jgi:hypothetical protein
LLLHSITLLKKAQAVRRHYLAAGAVIGDPPDTGAVAESLGDASGTIREPASISSR